MIRYIHGILAEKKPTEAIIEVAGIGYHLLIPASSYQKLPDVGKPVKLFTHYHVREDAILLYGFASETERAAFELVITVSGIGPKMGLAVLSGMNPQELQEHLINGDATMLTRIPGVGKKMAERMILDLKDKFASLSLPSSNTLTGSPETAAARADALSALEALGLSRAMAEKKLRTVLKNKPEIRTAEDLIRFALREP
jgi:Holliday junction DNA helicase RuvA